MERRGSRSRARAGTPALYLPARQGPDKTTVNILFTLEHFPIERTDKVGCGGKQRVSAVEAGFASSASLSS